MSRNDLLDLKIGHQDSCLSNCRQDDFSYHEIINFNQSYPAGG